MSDGPSLPSLRPFRKSRREATTASDMKAIIVGGSICGCACAHALLKIGCEVVVLERATSVTAAGAVCSPTYSAEHLPSAYNLKCFP